MYYNEHETDYVFTQQQKENGADRAAGYYPYANAAQPKKKKRGGWLKTTAIALCCSLLGGVVGAAAVTGVKSGAAGETTLTQSSRPTSSVQIEYAPAGQEMTAAEVYAAYVNSTVGITTTAVTTNFFGFRTASAASGSGFIISEDGYIVTNYHVIEDSESIKATTYDGTTYDAVLVGVDETNDVAVLKIDASGLSPVVLGDSDQLNVGDDVIAIGNPLGELTFSLTKGTVSALDREITLSSGVTMTLIQTDAAINSGNSGGALFNMYGEVVGITNAKYSGSGSTSSASIDNIGFAIPYNSVSDVIKNIIEKGYAVKPYIGVSLKDAADAALIFSVENGSPAEKAGLQANDIVTAANGKAVASADDLTDAIKALAPGDSLTLTVSRGGKETEISLTVGEKAQSAKQEETGSAYGQYDRSDGNEWEQFGFPFGFYGNYGRS